jgi:hypothetical protein
MSWNRSLWDWLAGSNIYCAGTDPVDSCPKAEPGEQRRLTLYTLASRLQKQKAKLNPHMAACDFIGYFISPVLCHLHASILCFISLLCHPLPLSCQFWQPVCFFSGLPFLSTVYLAIFHLLRAPSLTRFIEKSPRTARRASTDRRIPSLRGRPQEHVLLVLNIVSTVLLCPFVFFFNRDFLRIICFS